MNKRFVIAHVITGLSKAGAEMMLYNLLSKTNRDIFNPLVISLMDRDVLGERIESLGIPVYTIGMKPGEFPTPAVVWRLIKTINQHKPDLIQGWMYHANIAAWIANILSFQKVPVIWNIHHSINGLSSEKRMSQAIIKFGRVISKYTNQVVYVSQNSKAEHESLGYCSENSCVIPNGFDTSIFKPSDEARLRFRFEIGLPSDAFLIGLICRFHPMKDHHNFLQAARLLQKHYPDIHFILVGQNVDNNNKVLQQLLQKLKISHINLLGERSDIPIITAALDIACSSSAYGEAFPMIAGEAMSCCVPCVMTDVGDTSWAVGNTGKIVPPRNPEALANAWKELIMMGEEERKALGKAARARVIECFSLESVVDKFENLHESLLSKKYKTTGDYRPFTRRTSA
ncbi:glycosyltransferase [Cylindrospermum stagnale PCC 7417]|uniref:Glycosyltransferase n=1 Tax=Cylindrospermum stagnale PCC 7417 TaxID=56107 RepID=K9X0Z8_9NOST|nr:glycosyltransferase [Cylindrospermum stagnale]AFZ26290.1 glycosyltransferase [Cylindrospermum stagnale PCC 7417]